MSDVFSVIRGCNFLVLNFENLWIRLRIYALYDYHYSFIVYTFYLNVFYFMCVQRGEMFNLYHQVDGLNK